MILNSFEKALMNNPIKAWFHKHVEAKKLLSMGGSMAGGGVALEVGCGRGVGSELILNLFNADRVEAFDLDPHMVKLAHKRLESYGDRIKLNIGDATDIQKEDNYYDAIFDFGIIHHIPNWQDAINEMYRVLKPGGRIYIEEVLLGSEILHKLRTNSIGRLFQTLDGHPQGEDCFDHIQFINCLEDCRFSLGASDDSLFQTIGYYIADKPNLT